jgi:hypothetical protein
VIDAGGESKVRRVLVTIASIFASLPGALAHGESDEVFFETNVRPVLVENCLGCHGGEKTSRGLRVDSRESLLLGGESGAAIVPGDPAGSLLIRAIRRDDPDLRMPPKEPLAADVVASFERWIAAGAIWPTSAPPAEAVASGRHWAFSPLTDPSPPDGAESREATHPIDRFIAVQQRERGTRPVPRADRLALLRRLSFDLTGMPPSEAEQDGFLSGDAPSAFARAVDRYLASPRYGERWGRHWLDLVRYADTAGDDSDYPIREAGLYRDWVIDAFNSEKPYDVFLREQIAGDILARAGPESLYRERVIATGFLAQAKRFATRKQEDMHLIVEDTIHTIGQTVLGLTLRCARCHDHKYDPVTTEDYYALYGFFASTLYPHPGSEEDRRPSDLAPLVSPGELAREEAEFRERFGARIDALAEEIARVERELKATAGEGATADDAKKMLEELIAPLRTERDALLAKSPTRTVPVAYAVTEREATDAKIQIGGDPLREGAVVPRGVPRVLRGNAALEIPAGESGRRELAEWLTGPARSLTARVFVNRIWQHHFGKGLVTTPSNFGLQGEPPTHPELLDWLASRFIESGWSIKAMHRLILSSETWQRASAYGTESESIDPANTTYWRHDRRRLDAEAIRDTILLLGESLDLSLPPPHPFPLVETWRFTAHHQFKAVYPSHHRSVYLMVQRLHPHPYLALFGGPDTTASTAVRDGSTLPLQTLFLTNSPLVHEQAERLARALVAHSREQRPRLFTLYRRALGRLPTEREIERAVDYLERYETQFRSESKSESDAEHEVRAWASLVRVIFASSEFVYVD